VCGEGGWLKRRLIVSCVEGGFESPTPSTSHPEALTLDSQLDTMADVLTTTVQKDQISYILHPDRINLFSKNVLLSSIELSRLG
jgi:hypothetical protein